MCPSCAACAGELLDTLPPGVDELVAISNVVRFIRSPEYAHFTRIIFDTAPTGHTLRLLSAPDFLDASLGAAPSPGRQCNPAAPARPGHQALCSMF